MTQISTPSGDIHPRNPWIAALLSLALPGLGQFYNGDLNKALWLFLGFVLIGCFPGVTIAALYVPAVLMLPLLLIERRADVRPLGRLRSSMPGGGRRGGRSTHAANGRSAASMCCCCWRAMPSY